MRKFLILPQLLKTAILFINLVKKEIIMKRLTAVQANQVVQVMGGAAADS